MRLLPVDTFFPDTGHFEPINFSQPISFSQWRQAPVGVGRSAPFAALKFLPEFATIDGATSGAQTHCSSNRYFGADGAQGGCRELHPC